MKVVRQYIFVMFCASVLFAQESSEYRLKAAFVERFTRFVTWPQEHMLKDPVVIGVSGDAVIFLEMKSFFESVKIQNHPVEVRNILPGSSYVDFDIILVGKNEQLTVADVKRKIGTKAVLIIGDTPEMAGCGAMFAFSLVGGKLRFLINNGEIERSGLKASAVLLNSATVVKTNDEARK